MDMGCFYRREVVVDECYQSQEVLIQVSGPRNTGWRGTIEFSTDNKATYTPFFCSDCTGESNLAAPIAVDKNSNGGSEDIANCLEGNVCNLRQEVDPDSTPSPTSSPSLSPVSASTGPTASPTSSPTSSPVPSEVCVRIKTGDRSKYKGYLKVALDSGYGYDTILDYTPGEPYPNGTVIYEECYGTIDGIQVIGPDNNGWVGDIEFSTDDGITYDPFVCEDGCTGPVKTTAPIAIDKNGNSGDADVADLPAA